MIEDDPWALTAVMGGPMGMNALAPPQGIERRVFLLEGVAQRLVRIAGRAA